MKKKLAIVAAVGPGMGLAIAKRFGREGFDLALVGRSLVQGASLVSEIEAVGATARVYAADLTDVFAIEATFAKISAAQGPCEVMIYNGGVWNEGAPLAMPPENFHRDLALCVTGAYACARAVHADMKAKGGGTILFTGGGLALAPEYGVNVASLVAGKAALRGLGFALHEGLKADNIHVGMVTIAGTVARGGAFDPDLIADHYYALHMDPPGSWRAEIIHQGAA